MMSSKLSVAGLAALLAVAPVAAEGGCRQDLADLERVAETVVLGDRALRQIQGLLYEAEDPCEAGNQEAVALTLGEAWAVLLTDPRLIVPTAGALATMRCEAATSEVERRMTNGGGAGEVTRAAAEGVVAEARALCSGGDELAAHDKLAVVWTMLKTSE